jgi:arsenite methyltransferase
MDQQSNGLQRLASYSWVAVVLAVLVCYGSLALAGLLAQTGVTLTIHQGVRAAVSVVLVWLAVLGMGINLHRYRNFGPFILSDLGALLVSWVMVVEHSRAMESTGFILLMVAVFWDRSLRRQNAAKLSES